MSDRESIAGVVRHIEVHNSRFGVGGMLTLYLYRAWPGHPAPVCDDGSETVFLKPALFSTATAPPGIRCGNELVFYGRRRSVRGENCFAADTIERLWVCEGVCFSVESNEWIPASGGGGS